MRSYASPPWRRSIFLNYLDLLYMEDLFILFHLLIYDYVLISVWSLWIFILLLQCFHLCPLGTLTVSSCVLLTHPHLHYVFLCVCIFSISSNTRYSRTILCISFPSPRISHLFSKPWFLLLKHGIRNQDLDARLLLGISTGVLPLELLSSSLIEQWNYMWVYTNPGIYIYQYESSCINIKFILYLCLDILIY